jgi:tetratricopeptide (TPR) repeat protein
MAYYHAMRNDRAKAQSCARRALAVAPENPELLFNLALTYRQLGDLDLALGWLGKSLEKGFSRATVRDTPLLDSLRANPAFKRCQTGNDFQPQDRRSKWP